MHNQAIEVAAAAIVNAANEVLITQRHADAHQGGLWEFPGGKLEAGESREQALQRELREELGIIASAYRPLISVSHDYGDRQVRLHVFRVDACEGALVNREQQAMKWQAIEDLQSQDFPAADKAVIHALKLPEVYLITGDFNTATDFHSRLHAALQRGIRLVQLRIKPKWLAGHTALASDVMQIASNLCSQYGARLMLNIPDMLRCRFPSHGIHADSRKLQQLQQRPPCEWFSVSCHTVEDLQQAARLQADFAVLSPVQATRSHPDTEPLGWQRFAEMIDEVNFPVYALGGVDASHIRQAQNAGAQGVAGIGAFWKA